MNTLLRVWHGIRAHEFLVHLVKYAPQLSNARSFDVLPRGEHNALARDLHTNVEFGELSSQTFQLVLELVD